MSNFEKPWNRGNSRRWSNGNTEQRFFSSRREYPPLKINLCTAHKGSSGQIPSDFMADLIDLCSRYYDESYIRGGNTFVQINTQHYCSTESTPSTTKEEEILRRINNLENNKH